MLILGVETSCDETSVAVVENGNHILSNIIYSQEIHSKFGGVIPEVASREHLKSIIPIYQEALDRAKIELKDIGLIAATMGPGLVGPLLVGLTFAKALSYSRKIPFVPVNHLEGHLSANILEHKELETRHLTLIVSGGHTQLVLVNSFGSYQILGQTCDDAAGEAFDKIAKLLGLGYPGGAAIDRLASEGDPKYHHFTRPMINQGYQFSFSGLKTAVALYIKKLTDADFKREKANIAASFQEAVVDLLVKKSIQAVKEFDIRDLTISGGVAANSRLRKKMKEELTKENKRLFYPSKELCTDNGAMIAAAGYLNYEKHGPGELIANAIPSLKLI